MLEKTYKYLRPQKATEMMAQYDSIFKKSTFEVHKYSNILVTPLGQLYESPESERIIIDDTGMASSLSTPDSKDLEPVIKNKVLYAGFLHRKWGHFITESMARIWPIIQNQHYDKILFFSTVTGNTGISGNYLELFQLLGIDDKVIIMDSPVYIEQLYVPDIAYEHDIFYSDLQQSVYQAIIHAATKDCESSKKPVYDKVFLSRSQFKGANINSINIKELESFFETNGYKIVNPESLSLRRMINLLVDADCIATISGTLAHNFVFAGDVSHKQLIIVERHGWVNSFQTSLDKMMSAHSIHIDGYYLPKPSSSQDGIMLFAPTPQFLEFAKDYNMVNPEFVSNSIRTRHHELHKFIKRYRRYYGSGDGILPWEIESGRAIIEAVIASRERYSEWLVSFLPVTWHDMLTPRFIARTIKYLLRAGSTPKA